MCWWFVLLVSIISLFLFNRFFPFRGANYNNWWRYTTNFIMGKTGTKNALFFFLQTVGFGLVLWLVTYYQIMSRNYLEISFPFVIKSLSVNDDESCWNTPSSLDCGINLQDIQKFIATSKGSKMSGVHLSISRMATNKTRLKKVPLPAIYCELIFWYFLKAWHVFLVSESKIF